MTKSEHADCVEILDKLIAGELHFYTVPWSPGMDVFQMPKLVWIQLSTFARCMHLGASKGFDWADIKLHILSTPWASNERLALALGMLDSPMPLEWDK